MTPTPEHQQQAETMAREWLLQKSSMLHFCGDSGEANRVNLCSFLDHFQLPQLLADQAECKRLRKALKRISSIVETGQGCSINNHEIAVICLDIL